MTVEEVIELVQMMCPPGVTCQLGASDEPDGLLIELDGSDAVAMLDRRGIQDAIGMVVSGEVGSTLVWVRWDD